MAAVVRLRRLSPSWVQCAVLLLTLMHPGAAPAWSFDQYSSDRGGLWLGLAAGLVGHELGHTGVATSKGVDWEFDRGSIVYPGAELSDADRLQLASAGFQMQWLMAEGALRYLDREDADRRNLAAGIVLSHLAISAAYLTFLRDHEDGDVEGIATATGYSNETVALALAVPAVLDGWRLFGSSVPRWVPRAALLTKGAGIWWAWTY